MPVQTDYEASSESAVRHWMVPYARLLPAWAFHSYPVKVICPVAGLRGSEVCGTVLWLDNGGASVYAIVDFTCSQVYRQAVRNVLTYGGGPAEASWGPLNIGDPVYLDLTATMPVDVTLSTSPLDGAGAANPLFGYIVPIDDDDVALYAVAPGGKGTAVLGSTWDCGIMQRGAGGA